MRQPIFDVNMKVYAYELLFRSGVEEILQETNDDQAASSLIAESFFTTGIHTFTGGNPAFIQFTRNVLVGNYAQLIPKEKIVVEILDTLAEDSEVMYAVQQLKNGGYTLALNDFDGSALESPFLDLVNIIKVNFAKTSRIKQQFFARRFRQRGIKLVAEKVETYEEHFAAKGMGYTHFQGSFFCQPSMVNTARIPESKVAKLQLVKVLNDTMLDFQRASDIIKHDVAFSYKLLRFTNSAYFGLQHQVTNVKQALVFLGQKNLRKWASLMVIACIGEDKPSALLMTAMVRARCCELLAGRLGMRNRAEDLFLLGMFSTIDALLDRPMEEVLEEVPLAPDLKSTLKGEPGVLRDVLDMIIAYEGGQWRRFESIVDQLGLDPDVLPEIQVDAMKMAEGILGIQDKAVAPLV